MPGVWKRTLTYLGLVEDDEFEELDEVSAQPEQAEIRRFQRPQAVRDVAFEVEHEGIVRTIPSPRSATAGSIHKSEPRRFNEAVPVIMNLQSTDDTIARRLVDFASGLVYGLDGKIEMVANRVYLLTPGGVDVSAEDRERIAGGDLYNQF